MKDKYLWLEEVEGEKALKWVSEKNDLTLKKFEQDPTYKEFFETSLAMREDKNKVAYPSFKGDFVYNFWKDKKHKRGILRRTSLDNYMTQTPDWESIIDFDEMSEKDGKHWDLQSFEKLFQSNRVLVMISDGGKDANYIREFDLEKKSFVENGFTLEESKGFAEWLDRDTLFIARDFGEGSLTESGYPRTLKMWKRGTKIEDAKEVFSIPKDHVFLYPKIEYSSKGPIVVLSGNIDFFHSEYFLFHDEKLIRLDLPNKCSLGVILKGHAIFLINEEWKGIPSGSLVSLDLNEVMKGKNPDLKIVVEASKSLTVCDAIHCTKNVLVIPVEENIKSRLLECRLEAGVWKQTKINIPDFGAINLLQTNHEGEDYFVSYENFLTPRTVYLKRPNQDLVVAKSEPKKFETDHLEATQNIAISKDGTKVPYFMVAPKDLKRDGKNPTILSGYGGFQISNTPIFVNQAGKLWYEKGGVFVVANIRGGGEFGPNWHQAALKTNRHKAYEDFFAVAEDLIAKGITSSDHLGVKGGSNGGLLMGVCLTQRPDLFNAIHCMVPLLDMIRFHKLLAGASWIGEYGSPEIDEERKYLESYSPYHNLDKSKEYPEILFTTSTKDDRVHPGHARKMAALMEEYNHSFLYYENIEGGHAGSLDLSQYARADALSYSYFKKKLS